MVWTRWTAAVLLLLATLVFTTAEGDAQSPAGERRAMVAGPYGDLKNIKIASPKAAVRVYNSAFNALAAQVEPLNFNGHYTYEYCHWLPVVGTQCMTICSSDWSATVDQLNFNITPSQVTIVGHVAAHWCGAGFTSNLSTTARTTYSPRANGIFVTVNPTSIQPKFSVAGYDVPLPVHINVAPSLSLPPIPIATTMFAFDTANGPQTLRLTPSDVTLTNASGYLELQANVALW
jgi:hypothetical protein